MAKWLISFIRAIGAKSNINWSQETSRDQNRLIKMMCHVTAGRQSRRRSFWFMTVSTQVKYIWFRPITWAKILVSKNKRFFRENIKFLWPCGVFFFGVVWLALWIVASRDHAFNPYRILHIIISYVWFLIWFVHANFALKKIGSKIRLFNYLSVWNATLHFTSIISHAPHISTLRLGPDW